MMETKGQRLHGAAARLLSDPWIPAGPFHTSTEGEEADGRPLDPGWRHPMEPGRCIRGRDADTPGLWNSADACWRQKVLDLVGL